MKARLKPAEGSYPWRPPPTEVGKRTRGFCHGPPQVDSMNNISFEIRLSTRVKSAYTVLWSRTHPSIGAVRMPALKPSMLLSAT